MKEYADRQLRKGQISAADRRKYKGIARVAQAREWLISKLENAMARAATGKTERDRNMAAYEARQLHSKMSRLGMGPQK